MKLSKSERISLYLIMYADIEDLLDDKYIYSPHSYNSRFNLINFGLCNFLVEYSRTLDIEELPELYKHKPKKGYNFMYWYPCTIKGWEKRRNLLKKVLKEVL